ncbi:hypothetical protein [Actinacidiphila paucisporea]|uniref:Uncharacterized protein n=1 Tax=Actinacidiphila paucisporea TaxID=310782 RepID=A0A1M7QYN3_9ACTN|nr:hypothetical protein [Actinacidiphila paucisporea]SHN37338.1 hypothetical protein SAMN05216499_1526 [Actinacidiphila paucisporea]
MTDVSAEKRQQAKAAAANVAVTANDTAVVLGTAGVVVTAAGVTTGVGALAGVWVGATLGVGSFAAWFIGNRYQRIANDPPREDFEQVTESSARLLEDAVPTEEPHATVHRLVANHVLLSDALSAMLVSLERFDGAVLADDADAANRQAEAVRLNAQTAAYLQDTITVLAGTVNQLWLENQDNLAWSDVTLEQVQQLHGEAAGAPFQAIMAGVEDLTDNDPFSSLDSSEDPVLLATEIPSQPRAILGDEYVAELAGLSETLRELVV